MQRDRFLLRRALRRLTERYEVSGTQHDYDTMCKQIRNNEAQMLFRQSNTRTVWRMEYGGQDVFAVYDSRRHGICTFLPSQDYVGMVATTNSAITSDGTTCNASNQITMNHDKTDDDSIS